MTPHSPLKIALLRPHELTASDVALWKSFCSMDPALASPYFTPEFTQAVAAVRRDVQVAVLEQQGEVVGYFPFQRGTLGIGKPVGGHMSDYHGVIARPDAPWHADDVIRGCGLAIWDFDHVPAAQHPFARHHRTMAGSPYLDLSEGFEAYFASRNHGKASMVRQITRRMRRTERERGKIEFVRHVASPEVFDTLIQWKTAQFARTKVPNVLAMAWTRNLLKQVLAGSDVAFRGELSVLYIDDQVAAMDLGLRAGPILHSWFGHFDQALSRYSPGHILLLKAAEDGPKHGVRCIDLGKGAGYKLHFMSGEVPLLEGYVSCRSSINTVRRMCRGSAALIRSSPLRPSARAVGTLARPLRNWLAFR